MTRFWASASATVILSLMVPALAWAEHAGPANGKPGSLQGANPMAMQYQIRMQELMAALEKNVKAQKTATNGIKDAGERIEGSFQLVAKIEQDPDWKENSAMQSLSSRVRRESGYDGSTPWDEVFNRGAAAAGRFYDALSSAADLARDFPVKNGKVNFSGIYFEPVEKVLAQAFGPEFQPYVSLPPKYVPKSRNGGTAMAPSERDIALSAPEVRELPQDVSRIGDETL